MPKLQGLVQQLAGDDADLGFVEEALQGMGITQEGTYDIGWEDALRGFSRAVEKYHGEWGGAILPLNDVPLMLEPSHPYREVLHNKMLQDGALVDYKTPENLAHCTYWATRRKRRGQDASFIDAIHRLHGALNSLAVVSTWSMKAEQEALDKLKLMLSEHQFKCYFMTGMFVETSPRSHVMYCFRRMRPTVAVRNSEEHGFHILAALCLHPLAYYGTTYAGGMVPTDDVIAHLILMRGDERRFWAKANQHPSNIPNSGI